MASRWEGVRLFRASGKSPNFPGSSPNFPGSFSAASPEVLSLWNLTAIQGFPGSSPDFPGSFPDFPGGQPCSLGSLTPSPDSQKLSLKYINNSPGVVSCIRAGANTGATCIRTEMIPLKNLANMRKMIPQIYFPVLAQVQIQAPHVFAQKFIPHDFSCMYWFCAGGVCLKLRVQHCDISERIFRTFRCVFCLKFCFATPRPATGVFRALPAQSVPGVSLGVSLGPFGPRAPESPKSVPRVS